MLSIQFNISLYPSNLTLSQDSSVRIGTGCTFEESEFDFRQHPDQPCGPSSRIASGYSPPTGADVVHDAMQRSLALQY